MKTLPVTVREADLMLHALRAYINLKGNEVSDNTLRLQKKLEDFLSGETFTVSSAASEMGSVSSIAKAAAARENGQRGGRPPKNPQLPRPRAYGVWCELHLPRIADGEGRKLKQGDLVCEATGCRARAVYSY